MKLGWLSAMVALMCLLASGAQDWKDPLRSYIAYSNRHAREQDGDEVRRHQEQRVEECALTTARRTNTEGYRSPSIYCEPASGDDLYDCIVYPDGSGYRRGVSILALRCWLDDRGMADVCYPAEHIHP